MAPHGEAILSSNVGNKDFNRPPKLCTDGLQRTISDTSFVLISRDLIDVAKHLPPINEVEDAKCECCGMREECTPEYINQVREKFYGKWICGLCSEAVKEESEKNGGKSDEALSTHMGHCVRFNKLGRAFPVLCQAEAMREILRKGTRARSTSTSPKDKGPKRGGGIARSSSCMPAITREMNDLALGN